MSKHFKSTSERNLKKSIITKIPSASHLEIQQPASPKNIQIKCIANKSARQYCTTSSCTAKSLFVCIDDECICQNAHETCQLTLIVPTIKKIKAKISDPTIDLKNEINTKFDSIIKSLNQCRQSLISQIQHQKDTFKLHGLSQVEKMFLNIAQKNQDVELFSATKSHELWKTINQKTHLNFNNFEQFKTKLSNFQQIQKETIDKLKQHEFDLDQSQVIKESDLETTDLFSSKSINFSLPRYLFGQSLIIYNFQLSQRMVKLFQRQVVKNARLLYCASQKGFSLKEYFKLCGQQSNTLIVCRTQNDKIIGGYSPLSHQFSGKGRKDFLGNQPVADATKTSFIFSLSNNERFDLIKSSFAIYRYKTRSFIQFGEGELRISQVSNKQKSCEALINNGAYYCPNYKDNSDQRSNNLRFNGGQQNKFSIKQWQVWKLEIE